MKFLQACLLSVLAVSLVSAGNAPQESGKAPSEEKGKAGKKSKKVTLLNDANHGSVSGQFILKGDIPKPRVIVRKGDPAAKDAVVCAAGDVISDELVVNPKNRGIQHIFVYLRKFEKTVHPKLKVAASSQVVFDQKGCMFTPHTLLVRTDQEVLVKSNDNCSHNTHTYPIRNKAENFILTANNRLGVRLAVPVAEFLPTTVKCDIHTWMKAYWLILDHPYMAVTDKDGKFTVTGLPPGTYNFRCWHELVGYVAAGTRRGFDVTIIANKTMVSDPVAVPVAKFLEN